MKQKAAHQSARALCGVYVLSWYMLGYARVVIGLTVRLCKATVLLCCPRSAVPRQDLLLVLLVEGRPPERQLGLRGCNTRTHVRDHVQGIVGIVSVLSLFQRTASPEMHAWADSKETTAQIATETECSRA